MDDKTYTRLTAHIDGNERRIWALEEVLKRVYDEVWFEQAMEKKLAEYDKGKA